MAASKLSRCILTPNKVVSLLKWRKKGAVLALNITDTFIDLAYTHVTSGRGNSSNAFIVHELDSIPYMTKQTDENGRLRKTSRRLENERVADALKLIKENLGIASYLVSWPVKSNGKIGKECGKVLNVLDCLVERDEPIITKSCPFTLWEISCNFTKVDSGNEKHPLHDWLSSERLLQRDLQLRMLGGEDEDDAESSERSKVACTMLQQFVEGSWGMSRKEKGSRFIEHHRNQMMLSSFLKYDNPGTAQSAKMSLLM